MENKDCKKFNCRLELENYEWLAQQAKANRRSLTSEFNSIVAALRKREESANSKSE